MAILFDEIDDFFVITDDASMSLPDGDWCVAIWTKVDDNAGNFYQYLISNNALNANDSFNLFLGEVGAGVDANKWGFNVEDSDGTNPGTIFAAATGADGVWRLIVCQRNTGAPGGQEFELWFCEPGAAASLENTASDANFDAVDGDDWNIGQRWDGNVDRRYGSVASGFFKINVALTQGEIEALANGCQIYALGHDPDCLLLMIESVATLPDLFGSNNAVRNSAPTTTAEHPPIISTGPSLSRIDEDEPGPPHPPHPEPPPPETFLVVWTTPSHEQELGLAVMFWNPSINPATHVYTPRGNLVTTYSERDVSTYTHVVKAVGGYWSAALTINGNQQLVEDWLVYGLGRHVEVYDHSLACAWEGFVNQLTISLGPLAITRGPLLDIANRVAVVYSGTATGVDPPAQGNRVSTPDADDTSSQNRWGIIGKRLSAGGMIQTNALEVRDAYLNENKEPKISKKLATGTGLQVVVQCLGYVHWMNQYPYANTGVSGTEDLSTKIGNVLDAEPNSLFASTNAMITTNTLEAPQYEDGGRMAWEIIKGLVAQGDTNHYRYLFGVYDDRQAVYEQAERVEPRYQMALYEPEQRIEIYIAGQEVKPWNVRPGEWLFFSDFLPGKATPATLQEDPRFMFIESATFTAPLGLALEGGRTDTIPQRIAKMGLAGIGA